jgi:hypothetical protein
MKCTLPRVVTERSRRVVILPKQRALCGPSAFPIKGLWQVVTIEVAG